MKDVRIVIVYFPEDTHKMITRDSNRTPIAHPRVGWGVGEICENDRVHIELYMFNPCVTIDGVDEKDFTSDKEFKPLPKGYKYNTDLIGNRMVFDREKYKNNFDMYKKLSKEECIARKILVPKRNYSGYTIETEIKDKKYRVIKNTAWTTFYGNPPSGYYLGRKMCFDNYDDAMLSAKDICATALKQASDNLELDRLEEIDWVMDKVKDDSVQTKEILGNVGWTYGSAFRVYDGEVLFRKTCDSDWISIMQF